MNDDDIYDDLEWLAREADYGGTDDGMGNISSDADPGL